ncbi:MAG: gltX [Candidatus Saccharibacteria bacterium]|nr:gltX [Candidatus Saccharibacteria bacterium]
MSKPVRTRFAPSPTGFLHVGNVRAALFPWLIAKQANGQLILRIEDTDQAREVEGAIEIMKETLSWIGISWDEGPDIGGPVGPYTQSERKESYLAWAQKLIDKGRAYADPYTPEELEALRDKAKAEKKPFLFRDYRPDNPPTWDGTQPLRFKSEPKAYQWHDEVMGDLSAGPEAVDDFIIIKSDGFPTYNFAHVVDDYEMSITHVTRGLEYISSQPKYLNLYEALEIPVPILVHMPHVMGTDGKKKLSKRDGAKSLLQYRDEGFLPEAMLNFLASLGWNDGTEQEIFTREELFEKFRLDRIQKAGARFDEQRLLWMNGHWIRQLTLDDLYARSKTFWQAEANNYDDDYKKQVLALIQERLKFFAEIPELTSFFFKDLPVNMELIDGNKQLKKLSHEELKALLEQAKATIEQSDFSASDLTDRLNQLLETTGQKPGILFSLIRIASTQAPFSPTLADTLSVLGRETTLRRIEATLASL